MEGVTTYIGGKVDETGEWHTLLFVHRERKELTDLRFRFGHPKGWEEYLPGHTVNGRWFQDRRRRMSVAVTAAVERDGRPWVHASVASVYGTPTYTDLCWLKAWVFGPDRLALQLFVPKGEHVNNHPDCLHLWSCMDDLGLPDFTHEADTPSGKDV